MSDSVDTPLGPLPKVKKYDLQRERASLEIRNMLLELKIKHKLTSVQYFSILAEEIKYVSAGWISRERKDHE
jgi:hypothetical protein